MGIAYVSDPRLYALINGRRPEERATSKISHLDSAFRAKFQIFDKFFTDFGLFRRRREKVGKFQVNHLCFGLRDLEKREGYHQAKKKNPSHG
jgi:hypothetical protein